MKWTLTHSLVALATLLGAVGDAVPVTRAEPEARRLTAPPKPASGTDKPETRTPVGEEKTAKPAPTTNEAQPVATGEVQSVAAAPTLPDVTPAFEALEKAMLDKWEGVRSLKTHVTTLEDTVGGQITDRRDGGGVYYLKKKDGKIYVRSELRSEGASPPDVQRIGTKQFMLTICDGDAIYFQRELLGQVRVYKVGIDQGMMLEVGGARMFKTLRSVNYLDVAPDEVIDGRAVCVAVGKPKNGTTESRYYFDKETGVLAKMVMEDPTTKRVKTLTIDPPLVNAELADEHFVFAPPAGVEIQDMTGMMPRAGAAKEPTPKARRTPRVPAERTTSPPKEDDKAPGTAAPADGHDDGQSGDQP